MLLPRVSLYIVAFQVHLVPAAAILFLNLCASRARRAAAVRDFSTSLGRDSESESELRSKDRFHRGANFVTRKNHREGKRTRLRNAKVVEMRAQ